MNVCTVIIWNNILFPLKEKLGNGRFLYNLTTFSFFNKNVNTDTDKLCPDKILRKHYKCHQNV